VLHVGANLVILSMAWLTRDEAAIFTREPARPDMETLTYWVNRLEPLIRANKDEETIVVFANRCGVEDDVVYAGTAAVLGILNGEVRIYGMLGRGDEELLVTNTGSRPTMKLVQQRPDEKDSESTDDGASSD
jgi:hypothetical protein